ncbi:uncharacterized protein LOC128960386 [Oppia nitens]|uniref:uncharacterized protein LOC128960386 n=1 Tax=Oppia nitens TaxID=1686743 RepID=UPI0023DAEF7E|nr:uncharacterized protein LOC128960386 [Oppia nitens]
MAICPSDSTITFELITGQTFKAPADIIESYTGVMHLTDCLQYCLLNDTCKSVNFETGLCVLVSSSANQRPEAMISAQFPTFTIYAQKVCLKDKNKVCINGWAFERVKGYELKRLAKKTVKVQSRVECMNSCLNEQTFECRSVNFDDQSNDCSLSDMDRHTINVSDDQRIRNFGPASTSTMDYMENNCIDEPKKFCEFHPIAGKVLRTVDSVYENVDSIKQCKELCLNSRFRCHSFDYIDSVCRISHLDKNSVTHLDNPYLKVSAQTTYELLMCYNVTIQCHSREIVTKVKTSRLFNGKIYARDQPNHCLNDISNSLEFNITMKYNNDDCGVRQSSPGHFINDIVIQHHDLVVTTKDLALGIYCRFNLYNDSMSFLDLTIDG